MRRLLTLTVTVAAGVTAAVAAPVGAAGAQAGATATEVDVVYRTVDGEQVRADVYLPAGSSTDRPAVLLLHGGGWEGGDKSELEWAGAALADLGYVAVSANYRLAPEHPFPAAVDDVRAAVRWLRAPEQQERYGIDPKLIGAAGSSAGGHLVGMLAAMGHGRRDRGSRIAVGVSWSGPMDLRKPAADVDHGRASSTGNGVPIMLGCTRRDCPADPRAPRVARALRRPDRRTPVHGRGRDRPHPPELGEADGPRDDSRRHPPQAPDRAGRRPRRDARAVRERGERHVPRPVPPGTRTLTAVEEAPAWHRPRHPATSVSGIPRPEGAS